MTNPSHAAPFATRAPRNRGAGKGAPAPMRSVERGAADASTSVPLWHQLQLVAQVVEKVHAGVSGTAALEAVNPLMRPGVQALAFAVWRNWGRAQALRQRLAKRKPAPAVDALLCTALALGWNASTAPYDAFTLVNQVVEAAKRSPPLRAQAAFLNACLRRFVREQSACVRQTDNDLQARWNHPLWWISQLQKDHPKHWQTLLAAANLPPPLVLRVNTQRSSVAHYLQLLHEAHLQAMACGGSAIALERAVPVARLPGFAQGLVSVQDAAAQRAAPMLLEAMPQHRAPRILDACAAPGGKTAHLLELCPQAQVLALDVDAPRTQRIADTLHRLGLQAQVQTADAAQTATWWDGLPFHAILLDAPCTASGISRRHPDARWLRRESDIAQLATLQNKLLSALWPVLSPGGVLLYCTCSVFRAEGSEQIETFLAHHSDARLLPSLGHLIPQVSLVNEALPDNQPPDHDGFFYALLQKRSG